MLRPSTAAEADAGGVGAEKEQRAHRSCADAGEEADAVAAATTRHGGGLRLCERRRAAGGGSRKAGRFRSRARSFRALCCSGNQRQSLDLGPGILRIYGPELELESKSGRLLYFHATKPVQIWVGSNQLVIESVALL
jgi:hypothetical protein